MRFWISLLSILIISACSSLKPVELSSLELQEQISQGEVLQIGDRVKVITEDGQRHEFRVTEISDSAVIGNDTNIEITQIVALESRRFSGGKTALLAGGTILLYQVLGALAIAFTLGG